MPRLLESRWLRRSPEFFQCVPLCDSLRRPESAYFKSLSQPLTSPISLEGSLRKYSLHRFCIDRYHPQRAQSVVISSFLSGNEPRCRYVLAIGRRPLQAVMRGVQFEAVARSAVFASADTATGSGGSSNRLTTGHDTFDSVTFLVSSFASA